MYLVGQNIHFIPEGCLGVVTAVRKSIGALDRYDLLIDTGEKREYIEEIDLYPMRRHKATPIKEDTYMAFRFGQKVEIPLWKTTGYVRKIGKCSPPVGKGRDFIYTVQIDDIVFDFFTCELKAIT